MTLREIDAEIAALQAKADQAARSRYWSIHDRLAKEVSALQVQRAHAEFGLEPLANGEAGNQAKVAAPAHDGRVDALLERVAVLEARPMPTHHGIWTVGKSYPDAAFVTLNGGMWFSLRETKARPGNGSTDWRLVVKSGHAR